MKKYIYVACSVCCFLTTAWASTLSQAEQEYQQGNFTAAKASYTQITQTAQAGELWQAQLGVAASQYSLGEFLNAATTMYNYPLPENDLWKARFLLYRVYLAQRVAGIYQPLLNPNPIDSPSAQQDKTQWTRAQWQTQIDQDYRLLWELRTQLLQTPIEQENLILNLKDTDTRRIATLFDFVVNSWREYLQENPELEVSPLTDRPQAYLNGTARLKQSPTQHTVRLISQLLAAAAQAEGTNRQNARLFWQTDQILQPFSKAAFELENEEKAIQEATQQLQSIIQLQPGNTSWWKRFKNQATSKNTAYGRSYAAWQLASLLENHAKKPLALQTCQQAQKEFAVSYFTQRCEDIVQRITRVELSVKSDTQAFNRQEPLLRFDGQNLTHVYVRVYPTSFDELAKLYRSHYNRKTINAWRDVTRIDTQDLPKFITKGAMWEKTWNVPYEEVGKAQTGTLPLPPLETGFYVVVLSDKSDFDMQTSNLYGWVVNATDLAVFTSAAIAGNPADYTALRTAQPKTHKPDLFHIYTVNLQTGLPEPNASLELITGWNGAHETAKTNTDGKSDLTRSVVVGTKENTDNTSYSLDVLAHKNGSYAYTDNRLYFHFYNEAPVRLFAQTDLPIYRPGQTVALAAQAFERMVRGLKTLPNELVRFEITDPNGKRIFSQSVRSNALGSAQTEFTLPENNLLGTYSVAVSLTSYQRTYRAYQTFRVEEYKRPDYELVLNAAQKALEYGKKATLTGTARYYMGTPLEKAKVTYTLRRKNYIPPFYWWMRPLGNETKILLQGETETDEEGSFKVSFIPQRQKEEEEFATYVLEANVYDDSGRTISASRSYKISAQPHLFRVNFTQGFYDAGKSVPLADVELTDSEGNGVTGKVTLRALRLEDRQPTYTPTDAHCYNCPEQTPSLETLYQDFAAQQTAFTQVLTFQRPGAQTVMLPALTEGVYRLEISSPHAAKQQMIFVVSKEKSSLKLPDVALAQRTDYYPGETLRVLIGAGNLQGSKQLEVYQEDKFLIHRQTLPGGVEVFTLPLTPENRGGIGLRWFGASNYTFHAAQTSAKIPFDNHRLSVNLTVPKTAKPGQTVHWPLSVKNATGAGVNGLVNVTVYDKSLDYYAPHNSLLDFEQLYPQHTGVAETAASRQGPSSFSHVLPRPALKDRLNALALPSLNLQMPLRVYGGSKRMMLGAAAPMMMAKSALAVDTQAVTEGMATNAALDNATMAEEAAPAAATGQEGQESDIVLRSDFSPIAFFNPALPLTAGKAALDFTLPQSLTTWNVFGFALTPDVNWGGFTASLLTQKDLMLRLQLPRFYREADKGVLQAALTNKSNKKLTAQVALSIQQENKDVLSQFGVTKAVKTVTVPAGSTVFVTWEMTAPQAPGLYTVTATARTANQSDGEQKTLPVLPGTMRLLASTHAALDNGENTLTLAELNGVSPKDVEVLTLKLSPSLALNVINSMPMLLNSPYKDLVSSLSRYVPLAVVHQFYTTYPQLKEAVKQLPARQADKAAWNPSDPLRLQLLEQTPWLNQAQGRSQRLETLINLFDDKVVAAELEKELKNITRLQNPSGAFTWLAGGADDDYLTLYALESFAKAFSYQAHIPQGPAQKAMDYILPRVEKRLQEDKTGSVQAVAYALYAAYTLSSFPPTWAQSAKAKPYIKRWMDYANLQKNFMTPLGQIYAAAVYYRLGDDVKANQYLDLVLSRVKEDPLSGAYFAPEAQSWLWYNDTLSTQTVTLRTLLQMRPQSDKIKSLLQWLLFNRQVTSWSDTKAVTQAVFTVLDVMQAQGALEMPSSYQIRWAGQTQQVNFKPLDFSEDLQFVRTGTQITPQGFTAQIDKQSPQTDFASLSAVYRARHTKASAPGVINVERAYFLRVKQGNEVKLRPLAEVETVRVGDEIEVHLTITTQSAFEYVLLQDPKPAGFESEQLLSGWEHQTLGFYREIKDWGTNFFINWLPHGTFTLRYMLRPTVPGQLHALPAQAQSMYAPQYGAHSASEPLIIEK